MYPLNVKGAKKNIYGGHLKLSGKSPNGDVIDFNNYYMTLNGKPYYVISGEFHFSRYDAAMWEKEILKIKACGINIISTYVFWIHHEPACGKIDFSGNNNIREFVKLCAKHNMFVILRPGPYVHGECRNGGLPDWLFGKPFEVRSNDEGYIKAVERFFNALGEQVKDLMFTAGGNVVGIQLENEYMSASSPWEITNLQNREWIQAGTDGVSHMEKLRDLATGAGMKSAFWTCTGWGGAPYVQDEMLPLWGGYAYWPWLCWGPNNNDTAVTDHPLTTSYIFYDNHDETKKDNYDKKYPFACCELGGGMQVWYPYRFVVEPESVEGMILVTVASGCNFIGYFMFHGGRNPIVNNTYMNEQWNPRISYDFQAPLGDFGIPKESYKRIKLLHYSLSDLTEEICRTKTVIPAGQDKIEPSDTKTLRYAARSDGNMGFLFISNFQDHTEQTDKTDIQFEIETDTGVVLMPQNSKLTVKKGVTCMLPFGADLSGLKLRYATAQHISKIDDTYFFFTHEGMKGEFCFEENYKISDCKNASFETIDGKTFVYAGERGISYFKVNDSVKFCVMDRKLSLDFYKVNIKGKDYAILSKSNVYYTDNSISLETSGISEYEMFSYPKF